MPADPVTELRETVARAADSLRGGGSNGDGAAPTLERPPKAEFGDYSTNAAMLLAPTLGDQPRSVAERLASEVSDQLGERLDKVEVAGPGFLNLFLSDAWYREVLARASAESRALAPSADGDAGKQELIEVVSANPTGPLTAASGRHAAYGDSVARLLEAVGASVKREYYVNDVGGQIERFAASVTARMKGEPVPEDGYEGEYVGELAAELQADGIGPDQPDEIATAAVERMRAAAAKTLSRFGVEYENWFSERALHDAGAHLKVRDEMLESGHAYESEGATWLRTTAFDDDKDRVLVRSDGETTYYLADLAYHRDKLERGADLLIDVLGADHHGYIGRLKAGLEALGFDPDRLEVAIMQLVHIVEGGERAQMSKRKGEFVTLDDLVDDIGADAVRWFMLMRSHDTPVDLDLELARKQSNDNPVYYVQYAHARIASVLRKAGDDAVKSAEQIDPAALTAPFEPTERALLKRLLESPEEVGEAAERRAPHRLCAYATDVAADFHAFYRDCKVVGAEGEGVESARLAICLLTKEMIARTLGLLGISAPERM